jgi:hypothetical protein
VRAARRPGVKGRSSDHTSGRVNGPHFVEGDFLP